MTTKACDVAVVGGGPAGLLAALLAARSGAVTVLVAPPPPADTRTTALIGGSVEILKAARVWDALASEAAPLKSLRIADAGRRLFRAPEALFHAEELGLEAFGWNVANARLTALLTEALRAEPNAEIVPQAAAASRPGEDAVEIEAADGTPITARLAIAADGRRSLMREAAGVTLKSRRAPQEALAFSVSHTREHDFVSTELHYEEGPFTLVPLPGKRSSLVWACQPERAERLAGLSPEELGRAATEAAGRLLGPMTVEGRVGRFPIEIGSALRLAANRTLLVGEAAHVLPPIGAQGLNLGFRDAAAAGKVVARSIAEGRDPGGDASLRAYARARSADVWSRTAATDLLNRSLLTEFAPLHAARGLGLAAISRVGPLRRFVMREGLLGGPQF
ncbi:UbiH/UbiF family hydroxylase [Chenggangzhangella methanolivorans]|uniref:UbiH/UbiF family hydroxylase n=1 Tax=Chenggangzhangella methanolivorans TaxID=1437009 RepID=A0A9E6R8H0_9HYPH|nr:UbiH/UbiF family hydroxylase [Chenggangzhangella methanolivorans]QZN99426.1 UbiH/UbiF family hydroxylase [Chenggangzhangella methanolivorans]